MTRTTSLARIAPALQGSIYVTSGLWPIVHLRSFEHVTGPKVDRWLVKTVGGLLVVTGASLLLGSATPRPARALRVLGLGTAAVLALVDVVYASRRRISRIYLADAVMQAAIGALWLSGSRRRSPWR